LYTPQAHARPRRKHISIFFCEFLCCLLLAPSLIVFC
jgi:hypothetical protein